MAGTDKLDLAPVSDGTRNDGSYLSIVVPCHNESAGLRQLVEEVAHAVESTIGPQFEVIVVDDGSTDETALILRDLASAVPQLRVVRHSKRYGQSAAMLNGVRSASAAWIVTLDGDGQNDPADIARLLSTAQALDQPDRPVLVCGRRMLRKDSRPKLVLSWIVNRWSAMLLQHEVIDKGCGLKVFRRDAFLALPRFDHMHRFLPGLFTLINGQLASLPVHHRPRGHGRSHYGVVELARQAFIDVPAIMWLKRRYLPHGSMGEVEPPGQPSMFRDSAR